MAGGEGDGQDSHIISGDELFFFDEKPAALPFYEEFAKRLLTEIDNVTVKVQKTQISFSNKYNFAFVSLLPVRKPRSMRILRLWKGTADKFNLPAAGQKMRR